MEPMATNIRDALRTLADQLPEGATWKDVAYEAYVRQEIEVGLEEARRGEFASRKKTGRKEENRHPSRRKILTQIRVVFL